MKDTVRSFEKSRHMERGRPAHVSGTSIYQREEIEMIRPRAKAG